MILIRTDLGIREVDARPILRGLGAHPCVDGSGLWGVTHTRSGALLVVGVPEDAMKGVTQALYGPDWTIQGSLLIRSEEHQAAIDKAVRVARSFKDNKRREERLAADVGGRVQPASGSRPGFRRDVVSPRLMIERKEPELNGNKPDWMSVSTRDLAYLRKQALDKQLIPAFVIVFGDHAGSALIPMNELDPNEYPHPSSVVDMTDRKSLRITKELSQKLGRERWVEYQVTDTYLRGPLSWALVPYRMFLEFAKAGTEL